MLTSIMQQLYLLIHLMSLWTNQLDRKVYACKQWNCIQICTYLHAWGEGVRGAESIDDSIHIRLHLQHITPPSTHNEDQVCT